MTVCQRVSNWITINDCIRRENSPHKNESSFCDFVAKNLYRQNSHGFFLSHCYSEWENFALNLTIKVAKFSLNSRILPRIYYSAVRMLNTMDKTWQSAEERNFAAAEVFILQWRASNNDCDTITDMKNRGKRKKKTNFLRAAEFSTFLELVV